MSIQQNLEHILSRIRAAELRAGRPAGSVRLVAVSKTFPAEDVKACHDAGQRIFGENKVQEGLAKIPSLPPDTEWHLIGPLQRNKVRKALEYFTLIHAVDSLRLARFIDTVAQERGKRPRTAFPPAVALRSPILSQRRRRASYMEKQQHTGKEHTKRDTLTVQTTSFLL